MNCKIRALLEGGRVRILVTCENEPGESGIPKDHLYDTEQAVARAYAELLGKGLKGRITEERAETPDAERAAVRAQMEQAASNPAIQAHYQRVADADNPIDDDGIDLQTKVRAQEARIAQLCGALKREREGKDAERERTIHDEIRDELHRARSKFPDAGGCLAALTEEVGELAKAVLSESAERVREEGIQVATMAIRVMEEGDKTLDPYRAKQGLAPLAVEAQRLAADAAREKGD